MRDVAAPAMYYSVLRAPRIIFPLTCFAKEIHLNSVAGAQQYIVHRAFGTFHRVCVWCAQKTLARQMKIYLKLGSCG